MATVDPAPISTFSVSEDNQKKTVYSLLSNIDKRNSVSVAKSDSLTSEDLVILRHNPATKGNYINRPAYLKLHRNSSPNRNSVVDKIKENFEANPENSRPVPKARRSRLTKSQLLLPAKHGSKVVRYSLNIDKSKDVNSNHIESGRDTLSNDEEEYVTIVRRSDSEETVAKIKEELSAFTLDTNMDKKNKTGFRKIFSVFRNKDKKKKSDDNNKTQNKDNAGMYSDNYQNESNNFSRQSPFRHTTGGENYPTKSPPLKPTVQRSDSDVKVPNPYLDEKIEREYAQRHIDKFNQFKQNFENGVCHNSDRYTSMDKPLKDSSSSASTLESDKSNIYANEPHHDTTDDVKAISPIPATRIVENQRDTPPRLLETKQDVRLVNPKALIPINSERALPNPYQNVYARSPVNISPQNAPKPTGIEQYQIMTLPLETTPQRPNLSDTYGTVFDSLDDRASYVTSSATRTSPREVDKVPRSPSLEPSKLKLPPNREIVPLSPRVRSPIPSDNISTEKIIATELLKAKKSPVPTKRNNRDFSPSHQRLEIDIDYPDNIQNVSKDSLLMSTDNLSAKPPLGTNKQPFKPTENGRASNETYRQSQASPSSAETSFRRSQSSPLGSTDKIITNAQVHINPSVNRTPTPNNSMQNLSLSPVKSYNGTTRPVTPSGSRTNESPKTPQKEDMRKSVEAYYWKEVKKLKDRENYDLYMLQMQYENAYPYFEEPASVRRSRSLSPSASRNSRRSLSLPRETKAQPQTGSAQEKRFYPNAIPENHAVNHQVHPKSLQQIQFQQQKYFNRAAPERRTFDGGSPRKIDSTSSLYRPIFKRGSLNTPTQQTIDDPLKRKVSFSGAADQNVQSWPTKNGFTKSPPQRRILERNQSQVDDDVFIPNTPNDNRYSQFKTNPRNDSINEEMYYNTKPNLNRPNGDQFYVSKSSVNPQYMPQKQVAENPYGQRTAQFDDALYGQPRDSLLTQPRLVRHGSIQIAEELYVPRSGLRRMSYQNNNLARRPIMAPTPNQDLQAINKTPQPLQLRREIILNDEIFGQFGGYVPSQEIVRGSQTPSIYSSRQSVAEYPQVRPSHRQISVNNKVCDFYGQIHDTENPRVQQTGVIMGQLHRNPGSPMMVRNSYSQLPVREPFVRNSRLTASANDMYHRTQQNVQYPSEQLYGRIESQMNENEVFNRPLPPVPQGRKMMTRNMVSDTESLSDINDMHRMMNSRNRGIYEEEWNSDGKSGRGSDGTRSDNEGGEVRGRNRGTRRDDPRRHTLGSGANDQYLASMAGQGGPLSRTMDLEGHHRGYLPPSNAMLFDDDPGIMSEVETSSTGFRRGGKQRSSLPVVRTPSKTLERPLGLVFLQYRNETKRALLPNEITSIDTVKALFVRSFPKQLTMEYLDSPNVKIYIHDSSKDMFYELEDLRSHLREIRDRSVLRLFESADVSGGLPMAGIGIAGGVGHFEDPSYFSEPEFDSEYQHQHIHKSKVSNKAAPYYMGSTSNLPRGAPFLRTYSPAVPSLPAERMKPLPTGAPPKPQRAYSNAGSRNSNEGPPRPPDRFAPFQRPANPLYVPDGYMSSPERGSRYEDPYYSQYGTRSGSITPVIDEEISDTELLDDSYSLYGVKVPPGAAPRTNRTGFPTPAAVPYDATRLRVENMERQLANLTGLVQKALTQPATLQVPTREGYRDKSVSFEKSVSFSDEPPDMNSPKQHSPQHAADTKPTKPAIKSSTLPRTSSQERDRLKPAPPPKPASLSPGQYDSRIYRDLQLTPEMYNQLRGLQKKAKDLRAEVRNLRRMSQAQAHSVKETIRDTFIKIRAMLLAGGEQVWQAGMDQERVRLTREEDLYKQEMLRLEKDLGDLESTVEELRGNVINRKTRVNMSDVENMALILSKSSKTVADLKLRFPGLQDSMKALLTTEMDKMMREEKFLKEEPERLESALRRCKKLTGTLVTLKRLASVQEQRLPCSNSNNDGRLSPNPVETPPVTPSSTHSKPPAAPRMGSLIIGGECSGTSSDSSQRPENALDALLDELQTFSKPHPGTRSSSESSEPPAIPAKGVAPNRAPQMAEIGRKGSMDSASFLPSNNLTVSTATGSLRRLHSYPSGSDTDNSPPIQPLQANKTSSKPPIPERNTELLQHIASGKRIPPPPPPRTSSKSPLASPTSPSLPPRSVAAAGLQHIQNVQNMDKPLSQFEQATQNLGLQTLRRNVPNRSSVKDANRSQTLPRNIGSNLQVPNSDSDVISASNSSSCESVNSQDGTKKTRKEELEQRHQELLKKQKALQEQYARLQQLQRGNNTLTVIPPAPDQLLKKTGSESNLLQKMGLQLATSQITGSLTNIPHTNANLANKITLTNSSNPNPDPNSENQIDNVNPSENIDVTNQEAQKKVYETDIL